MATTYAKILQIRREAGLVQNSVIADNQVEEAEDEAAEEIHGWLGGTYVIPFSPVPSKIVLISKLLSAGFLLSRVYPYLDVPQDEQPSEGLRKISRARAMLKQLQDKVVLLYDDSGNSLLPSSSDNLSGWPNSTTKDESAEDAGGDVIFRIKKDF